MSSSVDSLPYFLEEKVVLHIAGIWYFPLPVLGCCDFIRNSSLFTRISLCHFFFAFVLPLPIFIFDLIVLLVFTVGIRYVFRSVLHHTL